MNRRLLAIDQSLRCTAWCIFEGEQLDSLAAFGCIKTAKGDGTLFDRINIISSAVYNLYECTWETTTLCREGLSFGGMGNATRDLAQLVGAIENECGKAFSEVSPKSVKKFATGSGNATKEDMIAALPDKVSSKFKEQGYKKSTGLADLADAYFIGRYHIHNIINEKG